MHPERGDVLRGETKELFCCRRERFTLLPGQRLPAGLVFRGAALPVFAGGRGRAGGAGRLLFGLERVRQQPFPGENLF